MQKNIELIKTNKDKISVISGFKSVWLKEFYAKFIDYGDKRSLSLLINIHSIISLIEHIDKIQYFIILTTNTTSNYISATSDGLIELLEKLNVALEQLTEERIGNKCYSKEEINEYKNKHKNGSRLRKYINGVIYKAKNYFE